LGTFCDAAQQNLNCSRLRERQAEARRNVARIKVAGYKRSRVMKVTGLGDFKSADAPSTASQLMSGSHGPKSRSLWHAFAWPFVLTCGFLIFVIGSSIYLSVESRSTSELVSRTLRIRTNLFVLQRTVGDAESGQRGYLLTGDPVYLDAYQ
jgi:CHASE3 domain